jgi:asparagine synthase (glutamine-hydrolysing)
MCGIVGLIDFREDGAKGRVERAGKLLSHRGPDDASIWVDRAGSEDVVLGHRRLSIIDLSCAGAQPMLQMADGAMRPTRSGDERARLALVYNGEIYNYLELREELRADGIQFTSTSDTEVLLAAYARWGEECLPRLNGMFAFAVWDTQRRRLFCARDRFGEKPFYYALDRQRGRFAFASEVKALIGLGAALANLNVHRVYRFMRFGEQSGVDETIWDGVHRLLPSSSLVLQVTGQNLELRTRRYWDVSVAPTGPHDLQRAAAGFAELFRDSVRLRLRSDVPVGTSLSGGLDSSSVLCQIHALGAAADQKAFTARMNDPALDEGKHVDVVLSATGVAGFSVVPHAAEFLASFDDLAFHQEEPFETTSIFASYLVQRLARTHGVTVMLDGQGADEYLAGYAHYPAVILSDFARRGRFRAWHRERSAVKSSLRVDPVPWRAALQYWLASLGKRSNGASTLKVDMERDVSFLNPDIQQDFRHEEPRTVAVEGDALKARLYVDLMHGHLQELLRYADRNSMAASREIRLPFLDHRLVEYSLSLPSRFLLGDGTSKRVLREAMRGVVPLEILARRDKVGFVAPWASWWRQEPFATNLQLRLRDATEELGGLVDVRAVRPGSGVALAVLSLASARRQLSELDPRLVSTSWR